MLSQMISCLQREQQSRDCGSEALSEPASEEAERWFETDNRVRDLTSEMQIGYYGTSSPDESGSDDDQGSAIFPATTR